MSFSTITRNTVAINRLKGVTIALRVGKSKRLFINIAADIAEQIGLVLGGRADVERGEHGDAGILVIKQGTSRSVLKQGSCCKSVCVVLSANHITTRKSRLQSTKMSWRISKDNTQLYVWIPKELPLHPSIRR